MKDAFKITAVLTLTCMLCAFFLSLADELTRPKIIRNQKKKIYDSIEKLTPLVDNIEESKAKDILLYKLFDQGSDLIGYAFSAEGNGYAGKIKIFAVINSTLKKLEGIEIIESAETPGLGDKIRESFFKDQFKEISVLPAIECIKTGSQKDNQINAISGATISSSSVVDILNKVIVGIKDVLGER